jgi:hypothetical protein
MQAAARHLIIMSFHASDSETGNRLKIIEKAELKTKICLRERKIPYKIFYRNFYAMTGVSLVCAAKVKSPQNLIYLSIKYYF